MFITADGSCLTVGIEVELDHTASMNLVNFDNLVKFDHTLYPNIAPCWIERRLAPQAEAFNQVRTGPRPAGQVLSLADVPMPPVDDVASGAHRPARSARRADLICNPLFNQDRPCHCDASSA